MPFFSLHFSSSSSLHSDGGGYMGHMLQMVKSTWRTFTFPATIQAFSCNSVATAFLFRLSFSFTSVKPLPLSSFLPFSLLLFECLFRFLSSPPFFSFSFVQQISLRGKRALIIIQKKKGKRTEIKSSSFIHQEGTSNPLV